MTMNYTKCYLSEIGHNNFYYPTTQTALIPVDCDYTILPWIGGGAKKLTPIKIFRCDILPLDLADSEKIKGSMVVWVEDSFIAP